MEARRMEARRVRAQVATVPTTYKVTRAVTQAMHPETTHVKAIEATRMTVPRTAQVAALAATHMKAIEVTRVATSRATRATTAAPILEAARARSYRAMRRQASARDPMLGGGCRPGSR